MDEDAKQAQENIEARARRIAKMFLLANVNADIDTVAALSLLAARTARTEGVTREEWMGLAMISWDEAMRESSEQED